MELNNPIQPIDNLQTKPPPNSILPISLNVQDKNMHRIPPIPADIYSNNKQQSNT